MIDPILQAELRERFNPDGSELRKVQLRMLEMLKYIDRICRENNITYWLSSGTCLGAVRHGGFIPWDDDVDIEMLEPDYKRLLEILGTEPHDGYVLQDRRNEPTYTYVFAKLRDCNSQIKEYGDFDDNFKYKGIFIDIFCLEPSGSLLAHKIAAPLHWRAINYRQSRSWRVRIKSNLLKSIEYMCMPLLKCIDRLFVGKRLRHSIGSHFKIPRYLNEVLPIKYISFEDIELPIPENYDAYLSRLYGNYMAIPDLSKIHPHLQKVEF